MFKLAGQGLKLTIGNRSIYLAWTASPTAGATYRIFWGGPGKQLDIFNPDYTSTVANKAILVSDLAAKASFPGEFYFLVHAVDVSGTYEEQNTQVLILELDGAGQYIEPRPNTPMISLNSISFNGTIITVIVNYNPIDQGTLPTSVNLYARNPTGTYGRPVANAALVASSTNGFRATFTYDFGSNQVIYLKATAVTALGTESDLSNEVGPYEPTTQLLPAPTDFTVAVSRG